MFSRPNRKEDPDIERQLRRARRRLDRLERENAELRVRLAGLTSGEGFHARNPSAGIKPEDIVWILGSGRTGSSWLAFMMQELEGYTRWNEPLAGYLFGQLFEERGAHRKDKKHFILSRTYEEVWLDSLRALILDGANARFPELTDRGGYLVIKEPHSARSAPLVMRSMPESRMILLVRDPRDTVASNLSWTKIRDRGGHPDREARVREAEENPNAFVTTCALNYTKDIEAAARAFDIHSGRKVLIRYEDLRADTAGVMRRTFDGLELPFIADRLAEAVSKHAWENIPEEEKGEGKIRRKASPGGWVRDLTEAQVSRVEEVCAPVFDRFYPEA